MASYSKVILKQGKEEPVLRFHPWIFSGAIKEIRGDFAEGDIVEVFSQKEQYLATGYLLSGSIAVKLFSFRQQAVDDKFWESKIRQAFNLRQDLGLTASGTTNTYRLIHNEGDSIPGLIVDIYNNLAVIQAHSVGMYQLRGVISGAIQNIYGKKITTVYDKSTESLRKMTGFKSVDSFLLGSDSEFEVKENGNRFLVNPVSGQKTGFFLDQRENRQLISRYAKGRDVLNMFGYTGGFSVYAAAAGAKLVHTIDSSAPAIEAADRNLALNGFDPSVHESTVADARRFLDSMDAGRYDLIVLDPPAFAKNLDSRRQALKGYRAINAAAIKKIRPGGILFTFSCSQVVDRQTFTSAVTAAAIDAGRQVRILHHLSQPPDHPVNIFHQEGEYLKGLVLRVE